MKQILLDSDVILDFFLDRKPYSDDTAKILTLCEKTKIKIFSTAVAISNIYYILRKLSSHSIAIEKIKLLLTLIEIINIDKNAIKLALNSEFKDFEDALQNYSVELNSDIKIIITRNTKDFTKSNLQVLPPIEYLKILV